ncbi:Annexin-like protein RJ4 [Bienertia sinuspersici]
MATLTAPEHVDPIADAEALRKACQGWGTDEKAIIEIIGHRNAAQRKLIKEAYEQLYGEDLIKLFEKELHGNFEPYDREAVLAHNALKKSEYQVIVEISCLPSAEELLGIKRAYQARYKHSLEEDLLVLLVSVYRHETEESEPKLVEQEAEILKDCIKDKEYTHEEILRILATRSKAQLVSTFFRYEDITETSIAESLDDDKDFVAALKAAIHCIRSPKQYLEQVLTDALMNHGTDEDTLTRVIVTRAEKDLGEIKDLFYQRHSKTLGHVVVKETHWDYETFLVALLGTEED